MLKRIFNSEEGVIDRGAEFSTLLDLPFYLDLSIGLTMGNEFGHSHERQMLAKTPTHYMRIATFYNLANTNISNSLSYLGRTSSEQAKLQIWTVDLLAKKRIARRVSWLTQAEAAYKTTKIKFGESTTEFSAYIYQQYGLNQQWSFGLRGDFASILSSKKNHEWAGEANINYQPSEFSRLRLGYIHYQKRSEIEGNSSNGRLLVQTTFILGAHPSHDF
jgi:hypothetical protein